MIEVRRLDALGPDQRVALAAWVEAEAPTLYHLPAYARVVERAFGPRDLSLVALRGGAPAAFVPQWLLGRTIESVPFRDKGGPVGSDAEALLALRDATVELARGVGARGILWRDCDVPAWGSERRLVNVDLELGGFADEPAFWRVLSPKVRAVVRQAREHGLSFRVAGPGEPGALDAFYRLFLETRHALGVPAHPRRFFAAYLRELPPSAVDILQVSDPRGEVVASTLLFHDGRASRWAYAAASRAGKQARANDLLVHGMIARCIERRSPRLDMGADSPLQEGLRFFKRKWGGTERVIASAAWGRARELDHNRPLFELPRRLLRRTPGWLYRGISRIVVR